MKYFLNDWCQFKNGDVEVLNYPKEFLYFNYKDALKQQAIDIYENTGIKTLFISGGVDSQTKALGFILANIDCKLVSVRQTFGNLSNDRELFYAKEFCKRHNKELNIFDVCYDRDSLDEFLYTSNYFTTPTGIGVTLQQYAMKKYMDIYDEKVITGNGQFIMHRKEDVCYGEFSKPDRGYIEGIDLDRVLIFDTYSPNVFKYYEYVHRTTPEIQFLEKYWGKNLSYIELQMPFRPKFGSWEFLDDKSDYSKLSTIDWADDHSKLATLASAGLVVLEKLGYDKKTIYRILENKSKHDLNECFYRLYEFKTNINYKV